MKPETLRKLATEESRLCVEAYDDDCPGIASRHDGRASAFREVAAMLEAEQAQVIALPLQDCEEQKYLVQQGETRLVTTSLRAAHGEAKRLAR